MKLAYISTSLPMQCGLATFNQNLQQAIKNKATSELKNITIAVSDAEDLNLYNFPEDVKFIIQKNNLDDYSKAAEFINKSNIDACILQHEFGIFGGEDGLYVLNLLSKIKKTVICIMHTVLEKPSYSQLSTVQQLAKFSDKLIVMSHKAMAMLSSIYGISNSKLQYIAHGVPNLEPKASNPIKNSKPFNNRKTLLTFGLISRGKGLETVIEALPEIIKKHPTVIYVILGNTHPGVRKNMGEEYRDSLKQLAQKLQVEEHVLFIDRFVGEKELFDYLCATDIYVTPYLNAAQITSGTLSYAIGAGCAVVSTPYWHAQELLQNNRGLLFDFKNSMELASLVNGLLGKPAQLNTLKVKAYQFGLQLRWPVIGETYLGTIDLLLKQKKLSVKFNKTIIDTDHIPPFSLTHIYRLTDSTGIIQHATYVIPNLKEGYCLDDNARALLMAIMAYGQYKDSQMLKLLPTYLSYIQYMQNEDGSFRNFLSFDKQFLDIQGSEDSFGRTMWALGYMIGHAPNQSYQEFANELFLRSLPHINKLEHLRGLANTLIGICLYLQAKPDKKELEKYLVQLTDKIIEAYRQNHGSNWNWFEDKLTYDNAILPLSLWYSYQILREESILKIAMDTQDFLCQKTFSMNHFNPVGNAGWLFKGKKMAQFDQQAIETMGMVILLYKSFELSKNKKYLQKLNTCFQWFLGENSLGLPLYDSETKGCADGLQPFGVNRNQGAESTLAYLTAYLYTFKALELECKNNKLYVFNKKLAEA